MKRWNCTLLMTAALLAGCGSIKIDTQAPDNVIDYSDDLHGRWQDDYLLGWRQTGIVAAEDYRLYFDAVAESNRNAEYASFCSERGGRVEKLDRWARGCFGTEGLRFAWTSWDRHSSGQAVTYGLLEDGEVDLREERRQLADGYAFMVLQPTQPASNADALLDTLNSRFQSLVDGTLL